jgi:hypothetical protein
MQEQENEIWKPIPGSNYFASNLGRIKSKNKIRNLFLGKVGYYTINLSNNGVSKTENVHKIIAKTFLSQDPSKPCVNHKNGIKTDNRVENLEMCSYSDNIIHANRTGLRTPRSKLDVLSVKVIRSLNGELKTSQIASYFNVRRGCINRVISRKRWPHA